MNDFLTKKGYIGSGTPLDKKGEQVEYKDCERVKCPFCGTIYTLEEWVNFWECPTCQG